MAKRQSHKQSRISNYIQSLMAMEMIISDPAQKQKLREQIKEARGEWMDAGWERRFPHHNRDGSLNQKGKDEIEKHKK